MRLIRLGAVTFLLGLIVLGTAGCVVPIPVPVPVRGDSLVPAPVDILGAEDGAVEEGPPLTRVASLPVDASGEGAIQGAPTGEATADDTRGTFVLVLDPAPPGLAPRTTVDVAFDHSTKVYRNGQALGDPLAAMNAGSMEADPSAAGTVVVRFHIKDGRAFADRLDLSD